MTGGSSGTDDGTVSYTVAANTGTARTGTLTIAGLTTTVTQAGACTYTVAPTTQSVVTAGGSVAFYRRSTTTSGCAWTGVSNNADVDHGHGRQQWQRQWHHELHRRRQYIDLFAHRDTDDAGFTTTITQAGTCAYTVAPTTQSVLAAGGSQSAAVTTASGCNWTGVSNTTGLPSRTAAVAPATAR